MKYLYPLVNLIFFCIWVKPVTNVADIPFASLTLNALFNGIGGNILFGIGCAGCLGLLWFSLLNDTIWPWRWDVKVTISMIIRFGIIALGFWCLVIKNATEIWYIAAWFVLVPSVIYYQEQDSEPIETNGSQP